MITYTRHKTLAFPREQGRRLTEFMRQIRSARNKLPFTKKETTAPTGRDGARARP